MVKPCFFETPFLDRSCVIKRTLDYDYEPLITLVHESAQNAAGSMLPYLGFQILRLGAGQNLNQHRDYHNQPDYPNHTMKFGKYMGGSLQMLRDGQWHSYDAECQWLSFDALKVVPRKVGPLDSAGLGFFSQKPVFPFICTSHYQRR